MIKKNIKVPKKNIKRLLNAFTSGKGISNQELMDLVPEVYAQDEYKKTKNNITKSIAKRLLHQKIK